MKLSRNSATPSRRESFQAESPLAGFSTLLEQIGSAAGAELRPGTVLPEINDLAGLKVFLETYATRVLPGELSVIAQAYRHASAGQARELIALDRQISGQADLSGFAGASRQVGQAQLEHLRPLRDQRVAQRYLAAFETGQAEARHTLVYGLILAIYSMPLRQGLLRYAEGALGGLGEAAARSRNLSSKGCSGIVRLIVARLPSQVDSALGGGVAAL